MQIADLTKDVLNEFQSLNVLRGHIVKPDYSRLNLVNLGATILKFFGIETSLAKPLQEIYPFTKRLDEIFKRSKGIIIILIDSINSSLLSDLLAKIVHLRGKLLRGMITSTFPSITPTALMSFYTGLTPLTHGVLGFEFYCEKMDEIIIPFKSEKNIEKKLAREVFYSDKNIFKEAEKANLFPVALMPYEISNNPITLQMLNGTKILGYKYLSEIDKIIVNSDKQKIFYIYYSKLDEVIHGEGSRSLKILNLLFELEKLIKTALRRGFQIVLLSDHSFINVQNIIKIERNPLIKAAFNGGRMAYIYGSRQLDISERAEIDSFSGEKMIRDGWFGKGIFNERVGQTILIIKDRSYMSYCDKKVSDKATHGGYLMDEMLAPIAFISPYE